MLGEPPPVEADLKAAQAELSQLRLRHEEAKRAWRDEKASLKRLASERASRVDELENELLAAQKRQGEEAATRVQAMQRGRVSRRASGAEPAARSEVAALRAQLAAQLAKQCRLPCATTAPHLPSLDHLKAQAAPTQPGAAAWAAWRPAVAPAARLRSRFFFSHRRSDEEAFS